MPGPQCMLGQVGRTVFVEVKKGFSELCHQNFSEIQLGIDMGILASMIGQRDAGSGLAGSCINSRNLTKVYSSL